MSIDSPAHLSALAANQEYERRINRAIDFLRANMDRSVKLDELAKIACFSEFHFHRIFRLLLGETVSDLTRRFRLEKAARLLRYSDHNITHIALDSGFSSSATFARAFRAEYEIAPSEFRKSGEIKKSKIRKELFDKNEYLLPMSKEERRAAFPIRLLDMPARHVAYIRIVDAFKQERVLAALTTLIEWSRSKNRLYDGTLFGMSIDDPHVTPKHLYRYEVCIAGSTPIEGGSESVIATMSMPAMRYAVTRVTGDIRKVATGWDYLFRDWLIQSDYEPEHAPALEIFLDKERATDWSRFELDLCLPIKKLRSTAAF